MPSAVRNSVVDAFVGALIDAGHKASRTPEGHLMFDGVDLGYRFRATEKQAHYGMLGTPTGIGHASVTLGSYRESNSKTHQFPERLRARERFDFDRAIPLLRQARAEVAEQQEDTAVQCANAPAAGALRVELGLSAPRPLAPFVVSASTNRHAPVHVSLNAGLDMTVADARRLFQALRIHGVLRD